MLTLNIFLHVIASIICFEIPLRLIPKTTENNEHYWAIEKKFTQYSNINSKSVIRNPKTVPKLQKYPSLN